MHLVVRYKNAVEYNTMNALAEKKKRLLLSGTKAAETHKLSHLAVVVLHHFKACLFFRCFLLCFFLITKGLLIRPYLG